MRGVQRGYRGGAGCSMHRCGMARCRAGSRWRVQHSVCTFRAMWCHFSDVLYTSATQQARCMAAVQTLAWCMGRGTLGSSAGPWCISSSDGQQCMRLEAAGRGPVLMPGLINADTRGVLIFIVRRFVGVLQQRFLSGIHRRFVWTAKNSAQLHARKCRAVHELIGKNIERKF